MMNKEKNIKNQICQMTLLIVNSKLFFNEVVFLPGNDIDRGF